MASPSARRCFLPRARNCPPEVSVNDQVPADQRTEASTSDGATAAADAAAPTWVAVDIAFEAAPESLPRGNTTVTLINNGAAVHDVTFEQLDDHTVVVAQGGGHEEATVELQSGTYTYYCSVPGHREAGMEGQLTFK